MISVFKGLYSHFNILFDVSEFTVTFGHFVFDFKTIGNLLTFSAQKIHISETTLEVLNYFDGYETEHRGQVDVKVYLLKIPTLSIIIMGAFNNTTNTMVFIGVCVDLFYLSSILENQHFNCRFLCLDVHLVVELFFCLLMVKTFVS